MKKLGLNFDEELQSIPLVLYQKGSYICKEGECAGDFFIVVAGAVKTFRVMESGDEIIYGFYLSGDWFTLEDLSCSNYCANSIALSTCSIKRVPKKLLNSSLFSKEARQEFYSRLSSRIWERKSHYQYICRMSARERLGVFINSLAKRYSDMGFSSREFNLPMTRVDIANYLGLTPETVSREFYNFQRLEMLRIEGKNLKILNLNQYSCCLKSN